MCCLSIELRVLGQLKKELQQSIEKHETELIKTSDAIWEAAETALLEFKSSKILMTTPKEMDLMLKRVAGIKTAFTASRMGLVDQLLE